MLYREMKVKKMCSNQGESRCGIYLSRYFDVELESSFFVDVKEIFIFKYIAGKSKSVKISFNNNLEPTPNFDSHVSSVPPNVSDSLYTQTNRSKIYLYEYTDDCVPAKYPRHCLPYAVLKVRKLPKCLWTTGLNSKPLTYSSTLTSKDVSQTCPPVKKKKKNKSSKGSSTSFKISLEKSSTLTDGLESPTNKVPKPYQPLLPPEPSGISQSGKNAKNTENNTNATKFSQKCVDPRLRALNSIPQNPFPSALKQASCALSLNSSSWSEYKHQTLCKPIVSCLKTNSKSESKKIKEKKKISLLDYKKKKEETNSDCTESDLATTAEKQNSSEVNVPACPPSSDHLNQSKFESAHVSQINGLELTSHPALAISNEDSNQSRLCPAPVAQICDSNIDNGLKHSPLLSCLKKGNSQSKLCLAEESKEGKEKCDVLLSSRLSNGSSKAKVCTTISAKKQNSEVCVTTCAPSLDHLNQSNFDSACVPQRQGSTDSITAISQPSIVIISQTKDYKGSSHKLCSANEAARLESKDGKEATDISLSNHSSKAKIYPANAAKKESESIEVIVATSSSHLEPNQSKPNTTQVNIPKVFTKDTLASDSPTEVRPDCLLAVNLPVCTEIDPLTETEIPGPSIYLSSDDDDDEEDEEYSSWSYYEDSSDESLPSIPCQSRSCTPTDSCRSVFSAIDAFPPSPSDNYFLASPSIDPCPLSSQLPLCQSSPCPSPMPCGSKQHSSEYKPSSSSISSQPSNIPPTPASDVTSATQSPYVRPTPDVTSAKQSPYVRPTPASDVTSAKQSPYVRPTPASDVTSATQSPYVRPTPDVTSAKQSPYVRPTPASDVTSATLSPYVRPTPASDVTSVTQSPFVRPTPASDVTLATQSSYVRPTPASDVTLATQSSYVRPTPASDVTSATQSPYVRPTLASDVTSVLPSPASDRHCQNKPSIYNDPIATIPSPKISSHIDTPPSEAPPCLNIPLPPSGPITANNITSSHPTLPSSYPTKTLPSQNIPSFSELLDILKTVSKNEALPPSGSVALSTSHCTPPVLDSPSQNITNAADSISVSLYQVPPSTAPISTNLTCSSSKASVLKPILPLMNSHTNVSSPVSHSSQPPSNSLVHESSVSQPTVPLSFHQFTQSAVSYPTQPAPAFYPTIKYSPFCPSHLSSITVPVFPHMQKTHNPIPILKSHPYFYFVPQTASSPIPIAEPSSKVQTVISTPSQVQMVPVSTSTLYGGTPSPQVTLTALSSQPATSLSSNPEAYLPSQSTTSSPSQPTRALPSQSTASSPSQSTASSPSQPTRALPYQSTASSPSQSTASSPSQPTRALPSQSITLLQSQSTTSSPSQPTRVLPPQSTASSPSHPMTSLPSQPTRALPSQSITLLPSQSTRVLPPQSTASSPSHPMTSLPSQPISLSPQDATSCSQDLDNIIKSYNDPICISSGGEDMDEPSQKNIKLIEIQANNLKKKMKDSWSKNKRKHIEELDPKIEKLVQHIAQFSNSTVNSSLIKSKIHEKFKSQCFYESIVKSTKLKDAVPSKCDDYYKYRCPSPAQTDYVVNRLTGKRATTPDCIIISGSSSNVSCCDVDVHSECLAVNSSTTPSSDLDANSGYMSISDTDSTPGHVTQSRSTASSIASFTSTDRNHFIKKLYQEKTSENQNQSAKHDTSPEAHSPGPCVQHSESYLTNAPLEALHLAKDTILKEIHLLEATYLSQEENMDNGQECPLSDTTEDTLHPPVSSLKTVKDIFSQKKAKINNSRTIQKSNGSLLVQCVNDSLDALLEMDYSTPEESESLKNKKHEPGRELHDAYGHNSASNSLFLNASTFDSDLCVTVLGPDSPNTDCMPSRKVNKKRKWSQADEKQSLKQKRTKLVSVVSNEHLAIKKQVTKNKYFMKKGDNKKSNTDIDKSKSIIAGTTRSSSLERSKNHLLLDSHEKKSLLNKPDKTNVNDSIEIAKEDSLVDETDTSSSVERTRESMSVEKAKIKSSFKRSIITSPSSKTRTTSALKLDNQKNTHDLTNTSSKTRITSPLKSGNKRIYTPHDCRSFKFQPSHRSHRSASMSPNRSFKHWSSRRSLKSRSPKRKKNFIDSEKSSKSSVEKTLPDVQHSLSQPHKTVHKKSIVDELLNIYNQPPSQSGSASSLHKSSDLDLDFYIPRKETSVKGQDLTAKMFVFLQIGFLFQEDSPCAIPFPVSTILNSQDLNPQQQKNMGDEIMKACSAWFDLPSNAFVGRNLRYDIPLSMADRSHVETFSTQQFYLESKLIGQCHSFLMLEEKDGTLSGDTLEQVLQGFEKKRIKILDLISDIENIAQKLKDNSDPLTTPELTQQVLQLESELTSAVAEYTSSQSDTSNTLKLLILDTLPDLTKVPLLGFTFKSPYLKLMDSHLQNIKHSFEVVTKDFIQTFQSVNFGHAHYPVPEQLLLEGEVEELYAKRSCCFILSASIPPQDFKTLFQLRCKIESLLKTASDSSDSKKDELIQFTNERAKLLQRYVGHQSSTRKDKLEVLFNNFLITQNYIKKIIGADGLVQMPLFNSLLKATENHFKLLEEAMEKKKPS